MRDLGLIGGKAQARQFIITRELVKAHLGEILIIHADMDLVLGSVERGDITGLATWRARLTDRLAAEARMWPRSPRSRRTFACGSCRNYTALPLVNIVDVVEREVHARGYKKVALFGTRFVVESHLFGMLDGIEVMVPGQVQMIHEAYMQTVAGSRTRAPCLTQIARDLPVDAVVLARNGSGTQLSMRRTPASPMSMQTKAHVAAILRELQ